MKKLICFLVLLAFVFCTGADYSEIDSVSESGGVSFSDAVEVIKNGGAVADTANIWSNIKNVFLSEISGALKTFTSVFFIAVLFSLVSAMQQGIGRQGVSEVAFFVVYCVVCVLMLKDFSVFAQLAMSIVDNIAMFLNSSLPIVGTTMISCGGFSAYSVMTPIIISAASIGVNLIKKIGIPAVMMSMSLGLVGSMSKEFSIAKVGGTIRSAVLWIISGVISVFCAIIGISGIGAGGFNIAVMRGVKMVAANMIPVLGGVLSESADAVVKGGMLLKNAVGSAALFCMVMMILYPVLKISAAILVYKVLSAVLSPFADGRICAFIDDLTEVLKCFLGFIAAEAVLSAVALLSLVNFKGAV